MAERRPRVLVAGGGVAELSPRAAAEALARGFAEASDVAVVALAEGGRPLGRALVEPDGAGEGAFLITGNYRAIMEYNCSNFYALSVALLGNAVQPALRP